MEQQPPIDRFVHYFDAHLTQIRAIDVPAKRLYQKLLYVSILDALSKSVYPNHDHRQRMVHFLLNFSDWKDARKVSLPHLVQLLKRSPEPAFENLRRYAFETFGQWQVREGAIPDIGIDPDIEQIKKLWPADRDYRLPNGLSVEFLQHCNLFYRFRNSLVHELRTPGLGMELKDGDQPYYHHLTLLTDEHADTTHTIELVYPAAFCDKLCLSSLSRLKEYFTRNELDPYDSYVFGTYWIDTLNA